VVAGNAVHKGKRSASTPLAQVVKASPKQLIDSFLKMAIDLCRAGTTGLSLLETNSTGEQGFRWTNLTGKLATCVGGTTPRNFSPCGIALDYNAPQLFAYPGRYFQYFNQLEVPIVDGFGHSVSHKHGDRRHCLDPFP
jgi:hypothetical protein